MTDASSLTTGELRARFDAPQPLTIGLEEEVMLLDPETFDLAPRAAEVLELVAGDPRFKPELPAAHLELMTEPHAAPESAVAELAAARRDLLDVVNERVRIAAAGVHPFAAVEGELRSGERYDRMPREYGWIARRQLVASLQVHVAVGGADRTLAVYNALRSYLPEIAALAANGAFYEGRDSGMASVRPLLCELLPRQGLPPAIESWEQFAATLAWGARSGAVPDPGFWWWELRPHVQYGTLEVRVPDAQATIEDAAGVAEFTHALVAWLAARFDGGERLPVHEGWRIDENRWSAARNGVEGELADLDSGERIPARDRLLQVIDTIAPFEREGLMADTRRLLTYPGPGKQRQAAMTGGAKGVAEWLAGVYRPTTL